MMTILPRSCRAALPKACRAKTPCRVSVVAVTVCAAGASGTWDIYSQIASRLKSLQVQRRKLRRVDLWWHFSSSWRCGSRNPRCGRTSTHRCSTCWCSRSSSPCLVDLAVVPSPLMFRLQKPLADPSVGFVGSVLSSVELTLHSEPEITDNDGKPYLCTDKVHSDGSACCGRGEIWMRGAFRWLRLLRSGRNLDESNSIGSGYYKLPEQTAADFDKDGWFHSGDIGLITPEGKVKIIDHKKNLVKLEGGEHVALKLINVTYNNHELVNTDAGGVCSFASHEIDLPVLLAQCKKKELLALAAANGVTGKDDDALCKDPKVMAAVKTALDAVAKAHKLPALMQAIAVMPVLEPWTADNGCLTATSKSKALITNVLGQQPGIGWWPRRFTSSMKRTWTC
ncbi:unnamed protein product [Cladocopium goreaui]|uniref:Long chain acyl-CoA synthetase 6, peroxisomal (AtLACS6) n=1 Tax=Cladocopium goreaui TaxID=2562237 RepID=A0A9P1FKX6_9DINO|nr:unnamed protein product [Cladocopium goreaui]